MIHLVALSFCSEDAELAERIWINFKAKDIGCYFYKGERQPSTLILSHHLDIYCQSRSRLYLLRTASFYKEFPSFELRCGEARNMNIVVPVEIDVRESIPNEFTFIEGEGWIWLQHDLVGKANMIPEIAIPLIVNL
jgi:hypothetical protein